MKQFIIKFYNVKFDYTMGYATLTAETLEDALAMLCPVDGIVFSHVEAIGD